MSEYELDRWKRLYREGWEAFDLLHEGIGEMLPPGTLPSQETINADPRYGPTFAGYAAAILDALSKVEWRSREL